MRNEKGIFFYCFNYPYLHIFNPIKYARKSRVQSFSYGGLGDNMNATLFGVVYYMKKRINQNDTLLAIFNTKIISYDSAEKIYKTSTTGKKGNF